MPLKPCDDNQIRNPKTNRCVSKTGAIGKRVIKANARASNVPDSVPSNVPANVPVSVPISVPSNVPDSVPSRRRVRTLEDHIASLRIMYPALPINTALELFPLPSTDSDEIRQSRIPVFNRSPPCPEGKIKNPKTKKCLNPNTKLGRKILDYLRNKYYEDSPDDYLSNVPVTIQYDNRQLTIPGSDSLNLETDIPQHSRSCPPGTVRDPDNRNKCHKINSKKGTEIMLNYRKKHEYIMGNIYAIPDYQDIPDFLDDYGELITIPAIYKLSNEEMTRLNKLLKLKIDTYELEQKLETELMILETDKERIINNQGNLTNINRKINGINNRIIELKDLQKFLDIELRRSS